MPRALIAGCGYLGQAAAQLLQSLGWEVTGITRTAESAAALSTPLLPVIACDISDLAAVKSALGQFAGIDTLIDCVSSGRGGKEEYRKHYLDGARNLLEIVQPKKFLFTSSTSVYAQTDGSYVTEESPAEPVTETGKILRETEGAVLAAGGIITRLAGIYGPGRWALLRKFLDGTAVIEDGGNRWLNHIHRDDAASAIGFLLNNIHFGGIFNVTDNTPLTQLDCHRIFADYYSKPLPPPGPAPETRKRGITSKRVSNAKLRALGWEPRYPSIREALATIGGTA